MPIINITQIEGTSGADRLSGDNEIVFGLAGNDTFSGGEGVTIFVGGEGKNTYEYSDDAIIWSAGGEDTLIVPFALETSNDLYLVDGKHLGFVIDDVKGSSDVLNFTILFYEDADISIVVFDGLSYDYQTLVQLANVTFDDEITWSEWDALDGDAAEYTTNEYISTIDFYLSGPSDSIGTKNNDVLRGTLGDDTLVGGAGNDQLWAGAADLGDDVMIGGAGEDTIAGGSGEDLVVGGAGSDVLFGGADDDTLWGSDEGDTSGRSSDKIWAGVGDDLIFAAEGDDQLGGGTGDDTIEAGEGNDLVYGGKGDVNDAGLNDLITGGEGDDTIFGAGGRDNLQGDEGDDTIYNGGGRDTVDGGAGDDTLWGSAGADQLTGGTGNDAFLFALGGGNDIILDFDLTEDRLDLSEIGYTDVTEIQAIASDTDQGLVLMIDNTMSITINGLTISDLAFMDLVF